MFSLQSLNISLTFKRGSVILILVLRGYLKGNGGSKKCRFQIIFLVVWFWPSVVLAAHREKGEHSIS